MKQKFAIKDRVIIKRIKKQNKEKINNDSLEKEQTIKEEK